MENFRDINISNASDPIYIPGLNGVRAIAALLVIVSHIDQFQPVLNNVASGYYKNGVAGQAVNMFFVLSGFLITFLLLKERNETGTIAIKNFYIRRILRIWPLYYLLLIISILLIQSNIITGSSSNEVSIVLYTFMMANVAFALHLDIATITPLWSIGVEEQFYLLWPHLINKTTRLLRIFLIVIILYLLLKLLVYVIFYKSFLYTLLDYTRIDIMAMGGVGAILVYNKSKILYYVFHPICQLIAWGILVYSISFHIIRITSLINNELNSFFSLIIILNVGFNRNSLISLDYKILNYLGKISYGLYIYHMLVIFVLGYICNTLHFNITTSVSYFIVLILTILIAHLSYYFFESRILALKKKYITINSSSLMA